RTTSRPSACATPVVNPVLSCDGGGGDDSANTTRPGATTGGRKTCAAAVEAPARTLTATHATPRRARPAMAPKRASHPALPGATTSLGSAGAELVAEHDGAAGGVVRDVRAHRLTLR